jgi:putative membrane protein
MGYRRFLLAAFVAVWTWAAIKPAFREDWLLENYLVFLFFPLLLLVGRYFELSNISYTLIALFGTLHVIGSHYTYSLVPFGYTLQHWFGAERNMYDRLVHLSFGLLLAYPVREAFVRIAKVRGLWGYYLPLDVTLALPKAMARPATSVDTWTAAFFAIEITSASTSANPRTPADTNIPACPQIL